MLLPIALWAENPRSITRHIQSTSQNRVYQSKAIDLLILSGGSNEIEEGELEEGNNSQSGLKRGVGYRVQVFSDNNARTAKNEARSKARNISARFPDQRTYVTYHSPYWRLRVGDFRNQSEANEFAEQIKSAFPAYAKEIRVVRDRITVN